MMNSVKTEPFWELEIKKDGGRWLSGKRVSRGLMKLLYLSYKQPYWNDKTWRRRLK